MDARSILEGLAATIGAIPQSRLLLFAVVAIGVSIVGSMMARARIPLGRFLNRASTVALVGILAVVVLQLGRIDSRLDLSIPALGMPEQVVAGGETRVEQARDGHFWLTGTVNGVEARFLVDTGATLTAVSPDLAAEAGLAPRSSGLPIMMETANGTVAAQLTTIDRIALGSVEARGLDAVIAPRLGSTNVIGMNLLSRLESYQVKGGELILVPAPAGTSAD